MNNNKQTKRRNEKKELLTEIQKFLEAEI